MTSSLVGSEMCIRDSCCNNHAMQAVGKVSGMIETRHEVGKLVMGVTKSCLLYTSDAADDM
eukprot:11943597-Prorocentrum_lima.AAC.1